MQLRMMDTLETTKILIAGGASRELAEAVTKDIALLRADLKEDIANLKCIVGMQVPVVLALGALLKYFMG